MYQENLITTSDMVEKYGVSRVAIQTWREKGMPYKQLTKRTIVYNCDDVENWYRNYKLSVR